MVDPVPRMGIGRWCTRRRTRTYWTSLSTTRVTREKRTCTLFICQIPHRRPVQSPAVYGCRGAAQDYTMRWCCWRLTSGCEPRKFLRTKGIAAREGNGCEPVELLRARGMLASQWNRCEPRELPPAKGIASTQRMRSGTFGHRNCRHCLQNNTYSTSTRTRNIATVLHVLHCTPM